MATDSLSSYQPQDAETHAKVTLSYISIFKDQLTDDLAKFHQHLSDMLNWVLTFLNHAPDHAEE